MFISRPIDNNLRKEAEKLSNEIPLLNNSITRGQGTLAGCIGEIAVRDYIRSLKVGAEIVGHYDYDILTSNSKKIEVKTKRCTSVPRASYECSVANFNDRQDCDYYFFTRVSNTHVYLLGFLGKDEFKIKSRQMTKGQTDRNVLPNGKNFKFHANCRNVLISELRPLNFSLKKCG